MEGAGGCLAGLSFAGSRRCSGAVEASTPTTDQFIRCSEQDDNHAAHDREPPKTRSRLSWAPQPLASLPSTTTAPPRSSTATTSSPPPQEERFSRRRHDPSFPAQAIRYCLAEAGTGLADLDTVAFYEDPALKSRRVMSTFAGVAPRGWKTFRRVFPEWLAWKARALTAVGERLRDLELGPVPPIRCFGHHESHAATAFFPSPFRQAAILTLDGVGEWATTTIGRDRGRPHRAVARTPLPALARPAVLGLNLLLRLQGRFRRVQADGPGALREAEVRHGDRDGSLTSSPTARSGSTSGA